MKKLPREPTLDKYKLIEQEFQRRRNCHLDEYKIKKVGWFEWLFAYCEHCKCRLPRKVLYKRDIYQDRGLKYCPDFDKCDERLNRRQDKLVNERLNKILRHVPLRSIEKEDKGEKK